MELTGRVKYITQKVDNSKTEGKNFFTRSIGLDTSVEINGTRYESYCGLQFTGTKCDLLDAVNVGDKVNVHFDIRGTLKTSEKAPVPVPEGQVNKNPANEVIYTNLNGYQIDVLEKASGAPAAQTVAAPAPVAGAAPKAGTPVYKRKPDGSLDLDANGNPQVEEDLPF